MYVCMYVCMYICMYIYTYVHSYIHIYESSFVFNIINVNIFMYTYIIINEYFIITILLQRLYFVESLQKAGTKNTYVKN